MDDSVLNKTKVSGIRPNKTKVDWMDLNKTKVD